MSLSIGKGKNKITLATKCKDCNGIGYFEVYESQHFCTNCDGQGYCVTEDGMQVLLLTTKFTPKK